ncbi:PREDICTED: uncharacterized protein LOC102017612 isoform X2 [Chinchilla lanigera]|uniref:uncharacterized protein LOC102017612 isoform X2 n=1 Tax=Chinchilla lanigera TaxID=34839 RepID=UPI00038EA46A|nr:PREDICTED: uncharacterized protein LOC102017612 isoform X2 [Chinchilla lanigera]XP_005413677.1 PREDICTED: uncharacterized protein LOC102017612 isoform X2 [Chinchilla lanigera]XP_005413678.1 PREDICTED: uncharacterized protein LOC102017612 isoform X2 [Chinchilla lanigera]XP_005413679.1 PREDICTED: uncharacterized protein LOC102017612 isoform X2 [Chinchilla lanigera]XP_005413680.1 PREDICTED: uncharacterized protein LOC102017612 isoform X2 [Chinchilla lanigera]XP_013364883.1 PREDICTED: uncharact
MTPHTHCTLTQPGPSSVAGRPCRLTLSASGAQNPPHRISCWLLRRQSLSLSHTHTHPSPVCLSLLLGWVRTGHLSPSSLVPRWPGVVLQGSFAFLPSLLAELRSHRDLDLQPRRASTSLSCHICRMGRRPTCWGCGTHEEGRPRTEAQSVLAAIILPSSPPGQGNHPWSRLELCSLSHSSEHSMAPHCLAPRNKTPAHSQSSLPTVFLDFPVRPNREEGVSFQLVVPLRHPSPVHLGAGPEARLTESTRTLILPECPPAGAPGKRRERFFSFLFRQGALLCISGWLEFLVILLPQPPKCWDDRCVQPSPAAREHLFLKKK